MIDDSQPPAAGHSRRHLRDYRRKRRATLIGAAVNLPLGVVKIIAGSLGHSQALFADGVHSLSDLFSDAVVLAAIRVGVKQADHDHPYGHARIETAAQMFVAMMLLLVAAGIGLGAWHRFTRPTLPLGPGWLALTVAMISLAAKEGLYWYTIRLARRTRSPLLTTNAWHHRSDALSSVIAVLAIAGSILGMAYLDAVGAVLIALMLAWVGAKYGWQSLRELVDTGLEPERLAVVRRNIDQVPGVRRMRRLRTRTMGGRDAFADVGVLVDPYISLTEAHRVSEAITAQLVAHVDEIADISVHIEPDGHADAPAAFDLPLREEVLPQLRRAWSDLRGAAEIERVTLHYLNAAIDVEVLLPLAVVSGRGEVEQLKRAYAQAGRTVAGIGEVRLLFR